jgi:sugar phosphate isomerase/epimerase
MYVACSTLCFGTHPLDTALRSIRDLHFTKIDLMICEDGPHLKPSELLTGDLTKLVAKLKASNVTVAAIHASFAEADGEKTRAELRAVCRLARLLTVSLVSVPAGQDSAADAVRLKEWVKIATAEGIILTIETNRSTLTRDPVATVELCRKVPGLGITLDPSHYVSAEGVVDYDMLFPFVKHVRLRDTAAKTDGFQVRVGQGDVEYGRIVAQLDRFKYDRALTVDVRDRPELEFPVEPEVRKLKYLLESLV